MNMIPIVILIVFAVLWVFGIAEYRGDLTRKDGS